MRIAGRVVQKDLDIAEYTDPEHNPMIPHVIVLEPGLVIFKVYNGYWFFGRPTVEELRQDLRVVLKKCRPDWVFDHWRAKHPDWRVLEHADKIDGKEVPVPMIEVPKLVVGGYEVGPVWFAWRPDQAFHEYMAQWMDKPTEGSLGGNAYRTLRLSVDWVAGTATFER